MYIVCFGDGLGNQMFQYAFYLSLKQKYPTVTVKMDINNIYGKSKHNGFELSNIFDIEVNECTLLEALRLSNIFPEKYWYSKFINIFYKTKMLFWGSKESWISDRNNDSTAFYKEVYELSPLKDYIFVGNWINEKYFAGLETELKERFRFKRPLEGKNYELAQKIQSVNSVSLHIRRGDYCSSEIFNVLDEEYYQTAINYMNEKLEKPIFFLFSDDKEYICNMSKENENYIAICGNEGEDSYIDMQLMSLCRHNIMANSSFSFWGAYLNNNKDKIVITPKVAGRKYRNAYACSDWINI